MMKKLQIPSPSTNLWISVFETAVLASTYYRYTTAIRSVPSKHLAVGLFIFSLTSNYKCTVQMAEFAFCKYQWGHNNDK